MNVNPRSTTRAEINRIVTRPPAKMTRICPLCRCRSMGLTSLLALQRLGDDGLEGDLTRDEHEAGHRGRPDEACVDRHGGRVLLVDRGGRGKVTRLVVAIGLLWV